MARRLPLVFALVLFAASTVIFAEVQTVHLKSGQKITGEVTKTEKGYSVNVNGSVVNFTFAQVESVGPATDKMSQYKDRLSKIDPKNADDHVTLAEWAYSQNMLEVAQKELKAALAINKDHMRAQLMLRKVEAAIADSGKPEVTTTSTGPATTQTGTVAGESLDKVLIPMEDIYKIRLEELRKDDSVTIEFKNNVLERFARTLEGEEVERFQSSSKVAQAIRIRNDANRSGNPAKFNDDIIIKSDPKFMSDFRAKVWPIIRGRCASAECHGGDKPRGGLKLFTTPDNERISYTNYIILDGFKNSKGRMIDRDDPEMSLVLQYGLPAADAKVHHPKAIQAAYPTRQSRGYRDVEEWIAKGLIPTPHPDYRIKWTAPLGMKLDFGFVVLDLGSTQPSTKPASAPAGK